MSAFFIAPSCAEDQLFDASAKIIQALLQQELRVGFCCPVSQSAKGLNLDVPTTETVDVSQVVDQICLGQTADFLEGLVEQCEQLKSEYDLDVIVVQGMQPDNSMIAAYELNQQIAQTLDALTIVVASPAPTLKNLAQRALLSAHAYGGLSADNVLGVLLASVDAEENTDLNNAIADLKEQSTLVLGVLSEAGPTDLQVIDGVYLKEQALLSRPVSISPAAFRYRLIQRAASAKKRIVLPEGDEPRTVQAAITCHAKGIAKCVLIAQKSSVTAVVEELGLSLPDDIEIIEPSAAVIEQYVPSMVERRKSRGLAPEDARLQLQDTVVLGTMMLADDDVDGLVSGAVHTTADTIRPAFQLIKTHPDAGMASSIFFMLLPDNVLVYGDCAINPNPNAEQLATIAIQSADSAKSFGIEPKVAMISYSTGASGMGQDVELVTEATQIAKNKRPDLLIDGPLQYDAASVASVASKKAPDSPVAGAANVFIFPDLNTGNTTYKAVQRSAGVISIGPMLQGLNKPVNDLSRGALVDDIVYTIALTAIQAI